MLTSTVYVAKQLCSRAASLAAVNPLPATFRDNFYCVHALKLLYPKLCQVFSTQTSHKYSSGFSLYIRGSKPYPPINKLAIVMALGWQLLVQTGKKPSLPEMGVLQGKGLFLSAHLCIEKWLTSANQCVSEPRHGHAVGTIWGTPTHLPQLTTNG